MRKPAKRRPNRFELPGLPGLESKLLLSADFPMNYAEVAGSQDPDEPMRFDRGGEIGMPPNPAMIPMRGGFEPGGRMSDSTLVRPAFDAFRQIPGGPERYATTVGDSLSVKFGTPIEKSSEGAAWSAPADAGTIYEAIDAYPAYSESPVTVDFSTFVLPVRIPLVVRINSPMQVNSSSTSKSERIGPVPLNLPSAAPILFPVSPDALATSSATVALRVAAAHENSGKSNLDENPAPNRTQPPGDTGRAEPSNHAVRDDPEFSLMTVLAREEEASEGRIRFRPEESAQAMTPFDPGDSSTDYDPDDSAKAGAKPPQPAIWSRISEAFGIDDTDFGSIGSEPLAEPVEIDTDELSAAVDRIIEGFAQPVEDSLGGAQFGKTIGMAAGVAIAIQVYARRRRNQDDSTAEDDSERSEAMTHVSPQLDQLDESDR